jgi:hypothetical protein
MTEEGIVPLRIRDGIRLSHISGDELIEIDNGINVLYNASINDISAFTIEKVKKDAGKFPSVCKLVDESIKKLKNYIDSIISKVNSLPTHKYVDEEVDALKTNIEHKLSKIDSLPTHRYINDAIREIQNKIDSFPNPSEVVTREVIEHTINQIENHVNSKIYGYDLLATTSAVNKSLSEIRGYIDVKTSVITSLFVAIKNVSQTNCTGDGTFVNVSYGDIKKNIGNDFDGIYYTAKENCVVEFKIGCVLKVGSGFNSSFVVNLCRYNRENVLQETMALESGLTSNNEDDKGDINILGRSVDVMMSKGDKACINIAVFGNNAKNVSLENIVSQRFSGRVISWL